MPFKKDDRVRIVSQGCGVNTACRETCIGSIGIVVEGQGYQDNENCYRLKFKRPGSYEGHCAFYTGNFVPICNTEEIE